MTKGQKVSSLLFDRIGHIASFEIVKGRLEDRRAEPDQGDRLT